MVSKIFGETVGSVSLFQSSRIVILGALILLLPALINERPFLFPDSPQYYDIGQSALSHLGVGDQTALAPEDNAAITETEMEGATLQAAGAGGGELAAVAGARSIWYSILVYGFANTLGLWGLIFTHAAIVSWLALRAAQSQLPSRPPVQFFGLLAALALLSPLGFHTGMIMPDILAGTMLLAMALLVFGEERSWLERIVLVGIIGLGAAVHGTSFLIGLVCVLLLVAYRLWPGAPRLYSWVTLGLGAAGVIGAGLANQGYAVAAERISGDPLSRPPFLMARVMADGTGMQHLASACAADPQAYAACLFDGHKYRNHNDILWAGDADVPRFTTSDGPVKLALLEEETRFVMTAVAEAPLQQFGASLQNFGLQVLRVGIDEVDDGIVHFAAYETWRDVAFLSHVNGIESCANDFVICKQRAWPLTIWKHGVHAITSVVFIIFIVGLATWLRQRILVAPKDWRDQDRLLVVASVLLLVLLANAALCGVLSGPHHRYQARMIWLVPLFLALTHQTWLRLPLLSRWHGLYKPQPR